MLNQLLPALNDCVLAFDLDDQRHLFIGSSVGNILERDTAELENNLILWDDLIDERDKERLVALADQLENDPWQESTYRITTAKNRTKWIAEKKNTFKAENSHTILLRVIKDHPSNTKTIDPLSSTDFDILFEDNPSPIWIYELQTLKFLKINKAAVKIYGYSEEEFLTKTMYDLIPSSETEKLDNYLSMRKQAKDTETGFNLAGLWKHQHKSNNLIYAEVSGHDYIYENKTCRLSIITDVTEKVRYREEHHRREQFLASLIDSQTNFLIRIDANGLFTFANKQFLKVFGFKQDALLGSHFSTTTLPEELELCEKAFYDCINNPHRVVPLVHRKPDSKGNIHWTEWEFISITDDEGIIVEIQGVGQDISKKVKGEADIKFAMAKLNDFIESITDAFFIIDNSWRFIRVNAAFEQVVGKTRDEIVGSIIWDVFPRILDTGFEKAYRRASSENVSVQFIEYFAPLSMWFNTIIYPSAEGLTVFARDITHQKNAQEEVILTKNNLEALINNTDDHVWSVDKDSRYVYMNDAYIRTVSFITGVTPVAGSYSYLHAGYTKAVQDEWAIFYNRALAGERYTTITESRDPHSSKNLFYEVSFNPIYKLNGEVIGVGCFAHNITAELEKEEALIEQNERLRNIASLSSHELRRPVASLLGLINILDRENFSNPENEQIIHHLHTIGQEIDDVIRLIVNKTFIV